ncbi:MAG: transketolase [Candidatus Magasanikbacteria bacterium CG10_big_fil_rev_8_21_14_0_10_43_6]|uniref:Transketolase n=1 Tax=Candidatus Magasanikbacteria bacterium CG10_big_fil_rev_8_21_14_0_10_43_6 TaxID=1974650 RepID=A0A2M6W130_9BACT|nr:MAG: transketolase [Candidatus Magasanikbacteria bacterium CG10_big_fil_rev_8_21_14_0_10_43_6]
MLPPLTKPLTKKHLDFLETFSQSVRHSIIAMLKQSQSGHPGGSLGCTDYLSLLYTGILGKTGEPIVVSNGHISPAVYGVLAEMGYISKQDVIDGFRKIGFPYEGHVTRHVPGVWYGTGPLGAGVSAAAGFALAEKIKESKHTVYALVGDGESQEGQVYEMMNFAHKYQLDNFVVFMDYNQVQLSDSLAKTMPLDPKAQWTAAGWHVIEVDGHDFAAMWRALGAAKKVTKKPVLLLAHTIMGKGVNFMEQAGKKYQATWHGKAPKPEEADTALAALTLTDEQEAMLNTFRNHVSWKPKENAFPEFLSKTKVRPGTPWLYMPDELTDCRTAYGKALLDLAKKNKEVVALTADLADSVKTSYVQDAIPERHIDCGVAEQHMVSCAGGMSLDGLTPFCSTFGAFMTSRAKDQARVNDINSANVKMVATHCGLSVGKDGPTHQAIDDMGSCAGFFNTAVMEPADPNHCDRMIRYVATHYGNAYVRMGREKIPVLTKKDGTPFFDKDYAYTYGKCDVLRRGSVLTVVASGPMVIETLRAVEALDKNTSVEIVIASSPKEFDETLFRSIKKTKRVLTVEDHNTRSGFGAGIARALALKNISVDSFHMLGVEEYQLSGTAAELYDAAGISATHIQKKMQAILKK